MVLVTLLALALGVATTVAAEGGGLLPVPPCSSLLLPVALFVLPARGQPIVAEIVLAVELRRQGRPPGVTDCVAPSGACDGRPERVGEEPAV